MIMCIYFPKGKYYLNESYFYVTLHKQNKSYWFKIVQVRKNNCIRNFGDQPPYYF